MIWRLRPVRPDLRATAGPDSVRLSRLLDRLPPAEAEAYGADGAGTWYYVIWPGPGSAVFLVGGRAGGGTPAPGDRSAGAGPDAAHPGKLAGGLCHRGARRGRPLVGKNVGADLRQLHSGRLA